MIVNTNESAPMSGIQYQIESDRRDMKMFNALLECDFLEAYNENGIISLTEEAEAGGFKTKIIAIKNFIVKKIQDFIEMIKTVAKNIKKALMAAGKKIMDSAIVIKYFKKVNAESIKGLEGSAVIPNENYSSLYIPDTYMTEYDRLIQKLQAGQLSTDEIDDIRKDSLSLFMDSEKEMEDRQKHASENMYTVKDYSEFTNSDINNIKNMVSTGFILGFKTYNIFGTRKEKELTKRAIQVEKVVRKEENRPIDIATIERRASNNNIGLETAKCLSILIQNELTLCNKENQMIQEYVRKQAKDCRAEFLEMVHYVAKKNQIDSTSVSTESYTDQDSIHYMITEASNDYVDKCFEKYVG
jgi:hypothetical protein